MSDEIVRAQRTSVSHIVTVPSKILREVFMTVVATEKYLHDVPDVARLWRLALNCH
jgi:hypothetical protein